MFGSNYIISLFMLANESPSEGMGHMKWQTYFRVAKNNINFSVIEFK